MGTKKEYNSQTKLDFPSCTYFSVPASIILDANGDERRVTAFSYLSSKRGLDNSVVFSVWNVLKWLGKKQDRRKGGLNDKVINAMQYIEHAGFVDLQDGFDSKGYADALFNSKEVRRQCSSDRFAIIYLDELNKIICNEECAYSNVDVILLVFAYLRMMIYRRANEFLPEQTSVAEKRRSSPEVYDCHYKDIADSIGVSVKRVVQAVDALVELRLIYAEELPRIKQNGKWVTNTCMFCNTYKREKEFLLAEGVDYYMQEIANKKKKLRV